MPLIAPSLVIAVDSSTEPVTAAEFRTHVHEDLSDSSNNIHIETMLTAARHWCESYTGRSFTNKTIAYVGEGIEGDYINLPRPPVSAISSIQYIDAAGTTQTWSSAEYQFLSTSAKITCVPGYSWPQYDPQRAAVTITYTAGYGSSSANVPAGLRLAIMVLAAHWYETRASVVIGTISKEVELSLRALLMPYRMREFA